jgi:hypothetical protein
MITTRHCAAIAIAAGVNLLLVCATPANAEESQVGMSSCTPATNLQRRIVDKAEQGMPALRRFVSMTRLIYGVDMIDIGNSLDKWRASTACTSIVAEAQPQD